MTRLVIPGVDPDQSFDATPHADRLAEPRRGVMVHFDDSSEDRWAVSWFKDPDCTNGYTWLVLDDGKLVELEDPALRTPHAGTCKVPNANSRYYGIAAATNAKVPVTARQFDRIARVCAAVFRHHRWPAAEVATRVVGHDEMAVYGPRDTPDRSLWGKGGRKLDPRGLPKGPVILDIARLRAAVVRLLAAP